MIIQHNIMALNSYNRLNGNNTQVSKNLEKLSSGYKINRAGDDAAGLAISEKMRAQITGLSRASQNAQDGISLVQTAEGQLTEVHSMLNRMVDLATQSSNGTYDGDNGVDRKNLQKEIQALKDEIDRIAETSNFNGIKLLDGSLSGAAKVTGTAGADAVPGVGGAAAEKAVYKTTVTMAQAAVANNKIEIGGKTYTVKAAGATGDEVNAGDIDTAEKFATWLADKVSEAGYTVTAAGTELIYTADNAGAIGTSGPGAAVTAAPTITFTQDTGVSNASYTFGPISNPTAGAELNPGAGAVAAKAAKFELDFTGKTGKNVIGSTLDIGTQKFEFVKTGGTVQDNTRTAIFVAEDADASAIATAVAGLGVTGYGAAGVAAGAKATFTSATPGAGDPPAIKQGGGGLNLQIGDTTERAQRISVSIGDMSVVGLALDNVDVSTESGAAASVQMIKDAINSVSGTRADLGAIQNRLEHTVNNISTTTENMTAAESRIRDTDMAKEMMAFTKNNVLAQAAQAMLAQANQQPQQVLQLLR